MPIIMQINQLIIPLRQNPQRILQKRDHNQEPADRGQVGLDGLAEGIQQVLDLARLLADRVERRGVIGGIVARRGPGAKVVLGAEVVAGGAADLRHGVVPVRCGDVI